MKKEIKINKYVKSFLHRGLIFGGLGPIVVGIIFGILELTTEEFSLGGGEVLLAVVSMYILAFVQAGASVFNQIEEWPLAKSLLVHFGTLYLAYSGSYVLNSWIPFEPIVLLIFSGIFAVTYFVVWLCVYLAVRSLGKKLNEKI